MQAVDRGFTTAFLTAFPRAIAIDEKRELAEQTFTVLIERAQASGQLRADFVPEDLTLALMANGGIVAESTEAALAASRRLVAYVLQAFRTDHAGQAQVLPPSTPLRLNNLICPPA